jgi:hypothetical protein
VAGQSSQDVLKQTVDGFAARVQQYADGIANRLGQPMSGTELSKDEAVARWNFTPLGSTAAADAAYHQKVAQGMPPGQALEQVYPMRSQLFAGGASVQDKIQTAKQIQGWAAEASGQQVPEQPKESTLPMLMAAQRAAQGPPQALPSAPAPPSPALLGAAPPPVPPPPVGPALPPLPLGGPAPPMPAASLMG